MGRSKNLHIIQVDVEVTQPTEPNPGQNWASGVIQVDKELSKELGRTIRNGTSFRLVGFGSTLRGITGEVLDTGFAGTSVIEYCSVTKNGVGAWQTLQGQWMKQKRLSSGVGKYVRYDDFEIGWDANSFLTAGRNSSIRMTGLDDATSEFISIYGTSVDGTVVTLESYYDNLNPIPVVSEDPFGAVIKTAKYTNKFPDKKNLEMPCTFSSGVTSGGLLSGAVAIGDIQWLPSDNHLSHMTGTLAYYFRGIANNTWNAADVLNLTITLVYEGWAPLAKVRSARPPTKKQLTTAASSKRTTRARRKS